MNSWTLEVPLLMAMSLSLINGKILMKTSFNSSHSYNNADYKSSIIASKTSDSFNSRTKRAVISSGAVSAAAAVGSLVGTTAQQIVDALSFSVGGAIEIENLSKYRLTGGKILSVYGTYKKVISTIEPNRRDAWTVHKSSFTTAGTSGIISYCVGCRQPLDVTNGDGAKTLYIVWQAPYDQNWNSNFLALGMYTGSIENIGGLRSVYDFLTRDRGNIATDNAWGKTSYRNGFSSGYEAQKYYHDAGSAITISGIGPGDDGWPKVNVEGSMGKNHKFTIKIKITGF